MMCRMTSPEEQLLLKFYVNYSRRKQMSMLIPYTKMQGAGNEILVVDQRDSDHPPPSPEQIRQLGQSGMGPSFDQLMWIGSPRDAKYAASYRVFNRDGSEVEQCGNGVRCVARVLAGDDGGGEALLLESPAGEVEATVLDDGRVAASMGVPEFDPAKIPFVADDPQEQYELDVGAQSRRVSVLSIGNPHCVLLVDSISSADVDRLGPAIEEHPRRTLNPGLEILAPVRDNSWVREEQLRYLEDHGMPLPAQGSAYSINRGLWGITIGGQETLTSENAIPEDAWVLSKSAFSEPQPPTQHVLEFRSGIPVALDGQSLPPVKLIEALELLAGSYGIGRGIHLGDTVLGTKGRVAFEAPAAITLLTAHRELEKLVLSAQQMRVKDTIAATYGDLVHEGKQLDLVCEDIEAFLTSTQRRVTGSVKFVLKPGSLFIEGVESPHSLLAATKGVYGEAAGEWTASDALGYARILSLPGSLQTRAAGDGS
jgi:diaminopimelate epimerase